MIGFNHVFIKGESSPLLVLHGTGGDEHDLIPLAQQVVPKAALLSPRGQVLENGMPRFFKRLAEGVFDQEDLVKRTHELADFVTASAEKYNIDMKKMIALGYSNGANIASSLLLLRPEILQGAMLLRPMVPFVPKNIPDLSGKRILMLSGLMDPIATPQQAEKLVDIFEEAGASVEKNLRPTGHGLGHEDVRIMQDWYHKQEI